MAFFSSVATIALAVSMSYLLLGPIAHFGVRCVVFLPDMHVLIVTYHALTPEAVGPLLSGRVSQVSTMTLDALIPRVGDVPLESTLQRACNMAFTIARHVEAQEIWLRTVVRYETKVGHSRFVGCPQEANTSRRNWRCVWGWVGG